MHAIARTCGAVLISVGKGTPATLQQCLPPPSGTTPGLGRPSASLCGRSAAHDVSCLPRMPHIRAGLISSFNGDTQMDYAMRAGRAKLLLLAAALGLGLIAAPQARAEGT